MTQEENKALDKLIEIAIQVGEVKGVVESLKKENEYLRNLVEKFIRQLPSEQYRDNGAGKSA